jgi:hypothetical protein
MIRGPRALTLIARRTKSRRTWHLVAVCISDGTDIGGCACGDALSKGASREGQASLRQGIKIGFAIGLRDF